MRTIRLSFVISLLVVAGRGFDAHGQTETNLHSFTGLPFDGWYPSPLVQGSDSNFYGTIYGSNIGGTNDYGGVFRISPSGSYTTLYSFAGAPIDGSTPSYGAGLVQGNNGYLYGTTYGGGANGYGTVFRISSTGGAYTSLYSFDNSPDGAAPDAKLVQGSDGNFYGTTFGGGPIHWGTMFRISPSGNYTNLYSFGVPPSDGSIPSGLARGSDGNFYGTTAGSSFGGTNYASTVFRISPSGTLTTLYTFNGAGQPSGLVLASDGDFYGTTSQGGTNNAGSVFRISPGGAYTNLYSFLFSDTFYPDGLMQGSDGNFYGGTTAGGTYGGGTLYRISLGGAYTNLYFFGESPNDGGSPNELVQGDDGNFYGTTQYGGANHYGTAFSFSVPLNPPPYPINQITGAHVAATNVVFSIPSIAGETYQLQSGTSMNPTNWVNVPGVSITNSIGALLTLTNIGGATGPQRFYRFDIIP